MIATFTEERIIKEYKTLQKVYIIFYWKYLHPYKLVTYTVSVLFDFRFLKIYIYIVFI